MLITHSAKRIQAYAYWTKPLRIPCDLSIDLFQSVLNEFIISFYVDALALFMTKHNQIRICLLKWTLCTFIRSCYTFSAAWGCSVFNQPSFRRTCLVPECVIVLHFFFVHSHFVCRRCARSFRFLFRINYIGLVLLLSSFMMWSKTSSMIHLNVNKMLEKFCSVHFPSIHYLNFKDRLFENVYRYHFASREYFIWLESLPASKCAG